MAEQRTESMIGTEFVEGVTLRERMTRARTEIPEVLEIGTQVASALVAAHAAGIVHRDIKPENVMIRTQDVPLDPEAPTKMLMGTSPGMIGTVAYMSPEQVRALTVNARTDIWSLGVMLYEMLAHHRPFEGPPVQVMRNV